MSLANLQRLAFQARPSPPLSPDAATAVQLRSMAVPDLAQDSGVNQKLVRTCSGLLDHQTAARKSKELVVQPRPFARWQAVSQNAR